MNDSNANEIATPRTRLPAPMVPRNQINIWSILKNCIGKELSKITMPVFFNEPLTMLQRACEGICFSHYLRMANASKDPLERMELVCAFIVASLSANCHRIIKPFNPLLYETYEYEHELSDGSRARVMSQQVSHHPPITAVYAESDDFIHNGSCNPKIKFWGKSVEVQPDGQCRIFLKSHNETYIFKSVSCSIHNVIVGKLWFEHHGPLDVRCPESKVEANLIFNKAGWFSNDVHRFHGCIVSGSEKSKRRFLYGKWSDYMKTVEYDEYEKFMRGRQQKLFRVPDSLDQPSDQASANGISSKLDCLSLDDSQDTGPHSTSGNSQNDGRTSTGDLPPTRPSRSNTEIPSSKTRKSDFAANKSNSAQQSMDIPNSRTLWRLEDEYLEEYYNFTLFTMRLNELTPELAARLPRTDSRFRPDVRKLEEGDLDGAANEKQRLEEKQREHRAKDRRFKDPSSDFLWFDLKEVPESKEKYWTYCGGYWESKSSHPERFPDLF